MRTLLLLISRCQPAYLGCYGNDWLATRGFDQLAADSVIFDCHFAQWPNPFHSGVLLHFGDRATVVQDAPGAKLSDTMQAAAEWIADHRSDEQWLFCLELHSLEFPWNPENHDPEALAGLEEEGTTPWFDPPSGRIGDQITPEDGERLAPTYAGMVAEVDRQIGALVDFLKEMDLYDDLLIILTSDRGLPLGEHGSVGEPAGVYNELIHVPLMVHLPGNAEAGRRVLQLTQAGDLVPTVYHALGLPIRPHPTPLPQIGGGAGGGGGENLLPVAQGKAKLARDAIFIRREHDAAIRTPDWYFIRSAKSEGDAGTELYAKPEDRFEVHNVVNQYPDIAEQLEQKIKQYTEGGSHEHGQTGG